jgi:RHS repeat-associated protein
MSFSAGNNMIGGSAACESGSSFCNDIAGNVTGDTFHQYSYDPDGNLIAVDGGGTATYTYDSLNQRVQIAPSRGTYEFVWDIFGRRVSNWSASNHTLVESNAYTDSGPIAIRGGGTRIYESQNWLGTERVRTTYNGAVSISIASLPWADQHTPAGDNGDQHDFAGMDRDLEDATEHAQYRQFSTNLGRWLSPDQYLGSYDFSNPQSFNRYSYALNDPANYVDPSGLDATQPVACGTDDEGNPAYCMSTVNGPLTNLGACDFDPVGCGYFAYCTMLCAPGSGYGGGRGGSGGGETSAQGPARLAILSAPNNGTNNKAKPLTTWEKVAMYAGCAAGLDPSYATPLSLTPTSGAPQDPLNSTEGTSGQRTLYGPSQGTMSGGLTPYNPGGNNSLAPDTAAGAPSYLVNLIQCIENVNSTWPK